MAETHRRRAARPRRCSCADRALPEGDPSTLPPPPAAPATPADLPIRWYYYTSGTTADPKGAQHTDAHDQGGGHRHVRARSRCTEATASAACSRSPTSPAPSTSSAPSPTAARMLVVEAFDAEATPPILRAATASPSPAPARRSTWRTSPTSATTPTRRRCSRRSARYIGGGAPKPPQLHYDVKAELGGVGIVLGLRHDRGPIVTMARCRDTDEELADTEGARRRRRRPRSLVKLDGTGPSRRGGRDPGQGPEADARLPRLVARRRRVRRDGYFRTGDLGRARRRRQRRASPAG